MAIVVSGRQLRIFIYVIGFIITTILGIITPQAYVTISAFYPFGWGFIIIMIILDLCTWIWQGNSPCVITKMNLYWSINRKDIHYIPIYEEIDGVTKKIGEWCIMFVGGIDYKGINPRSTSDYPVLIFPSFYLQKYGLCYAVDCYMLMFLFRELSPPVRHYLAHRYGGRIREKKTVIYFGATSTMDGTTTVTNTNLLEEIRVSNEYVTTLEEICDDKGKELKKSDERKTKKFFIKEVGNVEEP